MLPDGSRSRSAEPPTTSAPAAAPHPDAPGQVWHLPNDPNTQTTRQLVDTVYRIAGQPHSRLRRVHPLLLRLAALTNSTVRELLEMQYQFDEPFVVDSRKIANELGVRATPIEQALADTLATYSNSVNRLVS